MKPLASPKTSQRGVTLIESLVALVILALGILGLAAVQARMLVDTRTTNSRAIAIRLIGELNERMQINVAAFYPPTTPVGAPLPYTDGKVPNVPTTFPDPPTTWPPSPDCTSAACTAAQQAAYDLAAWRRKVDRSMLKGRARVWQISPRQLQVVIAWQANENTKTTLSDTPPAATDPSRQVAQQMRIVAAAAGTQCGGNPDTICHIGFIDIPPAR